MRKLNCLMVGSIVALVVMLARPHGKPWIFHDEPEPGKGEFYFWPETNEPLVQVPEFLEATNEPGINPVITNKAGLVFGDYTNGDGDAVITNVPIGGSALEMFRNQEAVYPTCYLQCVYVHYSDMYGPDFVVYLGVDEPKEIVITQTGTGEEAWRATNVLIATKLTSVVTNQDGTNYIRFVKAAH